MTEDRWRTSTNSQLLFEWLARPEGDRKSLLWFAACGRAITPLLPSNCSQQAVEWTEQNADRVAEQDDEWRRLEWLSEGAAFGFEADAIEHLRTNLPVDYDELLDWVRRVQQLPMAQLRMMAGWNQGTDLTDSLMVLRNAAHFANWCMAGYRGDKDTWSRRITNSRSCFLNPHLLRDIFGNPFRTVAFSPAWRTETAVSLSRMMYDTRNFQVMPVLADALEEAGCDNPDILAHCREPNGVHVRGCWVVDLVLNKS